MKKVSKKRQTPHPAKKPALGKRAKAIFDQAIDMPRSQRLGLAERLLDTLDSRAAVKAAWATEIARRIDDIDSGRVKLIPWSTVRAQLKEVIRDGRRSSPSPRRARRSS
jgi:putative addiction module component (TIGR02574 family)